MARNGPRRVGSWSRKGRRNMRDNETSQSHPNRNRSARSQIAISLGFALLMPLARFAGAAGQEVGPGEPAAIANWPVAPYWVAPEREGPDTSTDPGPARTG